MWGLSYSGESCYYGVSGESDFGEFGDFGEYCDIGNSCEYSDSGDFDWIW